MSDTDIRLMDLNEFRDEGFLQEVNRLFFHPRGLALCVDYDDDTQQVTGLAGIWDYRDDPEGIIFGAGVIDPEKIAKVERQRQVHHSTRIAMFNGMSPIQPTNWEEKRGDAGNE